MDLSGKNVLLIANPAAQRGNGAKAADIADGLLREWLGQDAVTLQKTERPQHAKEMAQQAPSSRYDVVLALGGDGVVHEVANGLMQLPHDQRPLFGVIPVGSGNDYARTLGMSEIVPDAIVQFLDADAPWFDMGCCNGEFFTETLSFGLDAAIALDTVERRKRTGQQGTILYLTSGLDQLVHHRDTYQVNAQLDGEKTLQVPVHMFAVQVGPTYGGGFRICPDADPTDGVFDICYAEAPMNMLEATIKFLSAKDGHHTKWNKIKFARASKLHLQFDRRPPCQVDGEPHLADSYDVHVEHHALRVLAPALS